MLRLQHPLGTQIRLLPITPSTGCPASPCRRWPAHARSALRRRRSRRMTDLRAAIGGEEDQVTGLQAFLADIRRLHHDHLAGGAGQAKYPPHHGRRNRSGHCNQTPNPACCRPSDKAYRPGRARETARLQQRAKKLGRAEYHRSANHWRRRRCTTGAGAEQRCEEDQCEAGRHRHKQNILIWLRLSLPDGQKAKPPAEHAGGLPSI